MADNQILFPLQIPGLTGLTLQIVSAPGNTVPSPLTVSEVSGSPGLYAATMTGSGTTTSPIAYAGLLRQDGDLVGYSTPAFLWDGTDLVYPVSLPEIPAPLDATATQNAAAAAIAAANLATPANITDAQTAILNQGNSAWVTATGFSTLTSGDIATALTNYDAATVGDVQVTVEGGFTSGNAADLAAARLAAEAVAIGDHEIDYATSTATQLDAAGNAIAVFDLLDDDDQPATSAATATKRRRRV